MSASCRRSWLVEHGAYELGLNVGGRQLVWYLFLLSSQIRYIIFTSSQGLISSIERLYRNAR